MYRTKSNHRINPAQVADISPRFDSESATYQFNVVLVGGARVPVTKYEAEEIEGAVDEHNERMYPHDLGLALGELDRSIRTR